MPPPCHAPQIGIDLYKYKHRILLLPSVRACPWSGYGQQGCWRGSRCLNFINSAGSTLGFSTVLHELGHNLGLQHSGLSTNQYGDSSCVM